jgi:hypothetical protein
MSGGAGGLAPNRRRYSPREACSTKREYGAVSGWRLIVPSWRRRLLAAGLTWMPMGTDVASSQNATSTVSPACVWACLTRPRHVTCHTRARVRTAGRCVAEVGCASGPSTTHQTEKSAASGCPPPPLTRGLCGRAIHTSGLRVAHVRCACGMDPPARVSAAHTQTSLHSTGPHPRGCPRDIRFAARPRPGRPWSPLRRAARQKGREEEQ